MILSFAQLKELEQRLTNANRQIQSLPAEIKDVQANVDTLLKNTKHLDAAVDKLDSLNAMVQDAEERINKIQSDRDGLARAEARIADLSKNIDGKLNALKAISETSGKAKSTSSSRSSSSKTLSPRKRDSIHALKQQGWKNEEIAANLGITLSEVELVLELPE